MKKILCLLAFVLFAMAVQAQTENGKTVIRGGFGLSYNYILSSQKTNESPSHTLFGGNGHSLRLGFAWDLFDKKKNVAQNDRLAPGFGIAFDLGFQFGKNSNSDLEAFASSITAPLKYKIDQSSTSWKQLVLMTGPVLRLGKRYTGLPPLEISATAGAVFRLAPRRIEIYKVDAAVPGARVYNEKEKGTSFAWQTNVSIPVFRLGKRITGCIDAGYGFNGGAAGVSFRLAKRRNDI